jgi:hypothetical protein
MRYANALSGFIRKSTESVSDFAGVVRNLIMDVRDSYGPEVHYMRGPGEPTTLRGRCPWIPRSIRPSAVLARRRPAAS